MFQEARVQALFSACAMSGQDPMEKTKMKNQSKVDTANQSSSSNVSPLFPIFKHPDEYNHLSAEQRDSLTQQMQKKHKIWAHHESPADLGKD
jgi:hypothetical protein